MVVIVILMILAQVIYLFVQVITSTCKMQVALETKAAFTTDGAVKLYHITEGLNSRLFQAAST